MESALNLEKHKATRLRLHDDMDDHRRRYEQRLSCTRDLLRLCISLLRKLGVKTLSSGFLLFPPFKVFGFQL